MVGSVWDLRRSKREPLIGPAQHSGDPCPAALVVAPAWRSVAGVGAGELGGEPIGNDLSLAVVQVAGIEVKEAVLSLVVAHDHRRRASRQRVREIPSGDAG